VSNEGNCFRCPQHRTFGSGRHASSFIQYRNIESGTLYRSLQIGVNQSRQTFQVLFRNNFALSRDITGLFQSFQSSSTVFDPAANPTLFRSTLVIIIKAGASCTNHMIVQSNLLPQDVVDSDKKEVVRE